jgi:hypothetical protein
MGSQMVLYEWYFGGKYSFYFAYSVEIVASMKFSLECLTWNLVPSHNFEDNIFL